MTMGDLNMHGGSRSLSPNAAPFHPYFEPCNIAIYNDGMPSLTLTSEADCSKILHGIQDEALDEGFPPDAGDAAELDDVDAYVEEMALLAFLEEQEQMARSDFSHIKKRWEARRKEGLKGRPRKPKHLVDTKKHVGRKSDAFAMNCKSLVVHSHHHHGSSMRARDVYRDTIVKAKVIPSVQPRPVIQQPRKQY